MKLNFLILGLILVLFSACKSEPIIKTLTVSGKSVACDDSSDKTCLNVKFEGDNTWTVLQDAIAGFELTEGMDYTIKVKELNVEGKDVISYELVEILNSYPSPIRLGDGSWNVTAVADDTEFDRAPFITVTLSESRIHGSTSCNKFSGKLVSDESKFEIGNLAVTKMACLDSTIENKFLRALGAVTSYEIIDTTLHLLSEDGKILIKALHQEQRQ